MGLLSRKLAKRIGSQTISKIDDLSLLNLKSAWTVTSTPLNPEVGHKLGVGTRTSSAIVGGISGLPVIPFTSNDIFKYTYSSSSDESTWDPDFKKFHNSYDGTSYSTETNLLIGTCKIQANAVGPNQNDFICFTSFTKEYNYWLGGTKTPHGGSSIFDGTSFSSISNKNSGYIGSASFGGKTNAVYSVSGSYDSYQPTSGNQYINSSENWDGTSWSYGPNISQARVGLSACGNSSSAYITGGIYYYDPEITHNRYIAHDDTYFSTNYSTDFYVDRSSTPVKDPEEPNITVQRMIYSGYIDEFDGTSFSQKSLSLINGRYCHGISGDTSLCYIFQGGSVSSKNTYASSVNSIDPNLYSMEEGEFLSSHTEYFNGISGISGPNSGFRCLNPAVSFSTDSNLLSTCSYYSYEYVVDNNIQEISPAFTLDNEIKISPTYLDAESFSLLTNLNNLTTIETTKAGKISSYTDVLSNIASRESNNLYYDRDNGLFTYSNTDIAAFKSGPSSINRLFGVMFGSPTAALSVGGKSNYTKLLQKVINNIQSTISGTGLNIAGNGSFDTESFDGTSFTTESNINVARTEFGGCGTTSAGLIACGSNNPELFQLPCQDTNSSSPDWPFDSFKDEVEEFNGTSWSNVNVTPQTKFATSMIGTQSAALLVGGFEYDTGDSRGNNISSGKNTSYSYDGTNWSSSSNLNNGRAYTTLSGNSSDAFASISVTYIESLMNEAITYVSESYNGTTWNTGATHPGASREIFSSMTGTSTFSILTGGGDSYNSPAGVTLNTFLYNGFTFSTGRSLLYGVRGGCSVGYENSIDTFVYQGDLQSSDVFTGRSQLYTAISVFQKKKIPLL